MMSQGDLTVLEWGDFLLCDFFNHHSAWFGLHIVKDNARDYGRFKRLMEGDLGSPPDMDADREQVWATLAALPRHLAWAVVIGELKYPHHELAQYSQDRIDGCLALAKLCGEKDELKRAVEGDFERIGKAAIGGLWLWGLQPRSWELPGGPGQLLRLDLHDCARLPPGCADLLPDPYKLLLDHLEERFTPQQRETLFDVQRGWKPIRDHRELFRTVGRMVTDLWELPDPRTEHKRVQRVKPAQPTRPEPLTLYCVGGKTT